MIVEAILNLLKSVITTVFGILPSIPSFDAAKNAITEFMNLIFSNCGLIGVFINVNTIKLCVPIIIVILNFERIYKLTLWIIKKIPMFSVN